MVSCEDAGGWAVLQPVRGLPQVLHNHTPGANPALQLGPQGKQCVW